MAFRNPIRRLSQLVADVFQTSAAGNYIKIYQRHLPIDQGVIEFYDAALIPGVDAPGQIAEGRNAADDGFQLRFLGPKFNGLLNLMALDAGTSRVELAGDAIKIGFFSRTFQGIDFGLANVTTDAAGVVTVPHGLGVIPIIAPGIATNGGSPWVPWPRDASNTAANLSFQMRRADTNVVAGLGVAVNFYWFAIA